MRPRGFAAASALALSLAAGRAHAQSQDPFFYGDEAALSAGSVVASGRDSGALWYNPAGLGGVQRDTISASASTFGIRIRRIPNALRVKIGARTTGVDLAAADVISVPNAVVVGTALSPKLTVAGGLLTTQRDLVSALGAVPPSPGTTADGRTLSSSQRLDLQADSARYHFGGALGYALTDQVRVGFALFGTYAKVTENVQYALDVTQTDPESDFHAFSTAAARITVTYVGAAAAAGVQADLGSVLLGLTVRSPEMIFTASNEGGSITSTTILGGGNPPRGDYAASPAEQANAFGEVVAPARALLGLAIPLAPSSFLELGADAAHGLPKTSLTEARQPVVNARAGIRYRLSPAWVVGGGVFSDRATERQLGDFVTSTKVDWYGVTAGVSKRTPLALAKDPAAAEALVLVTTLSLRAGAGFGQARALTVDLSSDAPRDDREDVLFFEVMPYLGSSVVF